MRAVRLAVIGAGKLGGYHATLAAGSPEFDLVAVVDPVSVARNALADKTGARPFADYRQVLGRVDAAVVATPTATHRATAVALLEAGVHVLVEKPIAPSLADAEAIVTAARRRGRVLQVGHVERFSPALEAFASGAPEGLGTPRFLDATRTSGYTFRSTDIGVVLDLMIHDIDLALSMVDSEVVRVSAHGTRVLGQHEDMAVARLRFASGCVAHLTASRVSYEAKREMRVVYDRGFVALDFAKGTATTLQPSADVLGGRFDAEGLSPARRAELAAGKLFEEVLVRTEHTAPPCNAIERELLDFAGAIRSGTAPRVTGEAGRDAVAIAERVIESIAHHANEAPAPRILRAA
ncbi:MAG: Gfo/Idh/MocA family protein [Lacipirellulaceae bacterium]